VPVAISPPELRVTLALVEGRVAAATGDAAGAARGLEETAAQAEQLGLVGFALEARRLLGELELRQGRAEAGRTRLAQVEADATARGYVLVARRAAAAR
jgi:hypothetical protein